MPTTGSDGFVFFNGSALMHHCERFIFTMLKTVRPVGSRRMTFVDQKGGRSRISLSSSGIGSVKVCANIWLKAIKYGPQTPDLTS